MDEFSNFARMPKVHIQSTDIHEITEQTVSLFKGLFKDIEFEVVLSSGVPSSIQADPEQMKRVFINILDNAIHAMNKKGEIKIQTFFIKEEQIVKIERRDKESSTYKQPSSHLRRKWDRKRTNCLSDSSGKPEEKQKICPDKLRPTTKPDPKALKGVDLIVLHCYNGENFFVGKPWKLRYLR